MKIKQGPSQIERVMTAPTYVRKEGPKSVPIPGEFPQSNEEVSLDHLVGHMAAGQMSREETDRPRRQERIPFGQARMQLASTGIPGYHLHWINDWHQTMPDRINQALRAGYQFVSQQEVDVSPGLASFSADLSDRVSRIVGSRPDGAPITAYMMKIPLEFYEEHQAAVTDRAAKVEQAIKRGNIKGKVGEDGRYIPKDSPIKMSSKLQTGDPDENLG